MGRLPHFHSYEAPPTRGAPLQVLIEKVPLSYTLYWQMVPLSYITSLEFWILVTAANAVFQIWINHNDFFTAIKCILLALFAFLLISTERNDRFLPFHVLHLVKSTFHIPEAWKRYSTPFRIVYYMYWEYPPWSSNNTLNPQKRHPDTFPNNVHPVHWLKCGAREKCDVKLPW